MGLFAGSRLTSVSSFGHFRARCLMSAFEVFGKVKRRSFMCIGLCEFLLLAVNSSSRDCRSGSGVMAWGTAVGGSGALAGSESGCVVGVVFQVIGGGVERVPSDSHLGARSP